MKRETWQPVSTQVFHNTSVLNLVFQKCMAEIVPPMVSVAKFLGSVLQLSLLLIAGISRY